jgi:hypothetical protein
METPTSIRISTQIFPQITIVRNFEDTYVDGSIYTLEPSIIITNRIVEPLPRHLLDYKH